MSFHDTANSILANVYYLKDVLTCVDDLHPSGMFGDMEMKNTAQNLSRFYGDRIGRARMNSKAELQPSKPPTGICMVTAEYIPEISQSGLARYFMIELKERDVQLDLMTEYQQLAAEGVLAGIMRSYVDWIRVTYLHDDVRFIRTLADTFQKQRSQIIAELHRRNLFVHTRVPDTLAHLQIGFDFLLHFLCAKDQINAEAVEKLRLDFAECLLQNAAHSAQLVESENITFQFCEKLKSLFDSGRCYVLRIGQEQETMCKGFIGYEDSDHYYLVMDAALSEVKKLAKEMGEHFSIGRNGLIQQLVEDGIIVTKGKRNTTTIRVTNTKQMSVAVFDKAKLPK